MNKLPIRVTFFGDSICVGQGVSIYRGWVTRIASSLDEYAQQIGHQILVTNASVNGRTTRQALEDMPYSVQSHGVDIMVVQFGLNDCNYWASDKGLPRVSPGAFKENIREIVSRGVNSGAFKVLLNNNHPTSRSKHVMDFTQITYEESNAAYSQVLRELKDELGGLVTFQDVALHFTSLVNTTGKPIEEYLLEDGLHLSIQGHDAYYDLMMPVLKSAVDEFISNSKK